MPEYVISPHPHPQISAAKQIRSSPIPFCSCYKNILHGELHLGFKTSRDQVIVPVHVCRFEGSPWERYLKVVYERYSKSSSVLPGTNNSALRPWQLRKLSVLFVSLFSRVLLGCLLTFDLLSGIRKRDIVPAFSVGVIQGLPGVPGNILVDGNAPPLYSEHLWFLIADFSPFILLHRVWHASAFINSADVDLM